ncbi:hypothetical protein AB0I72_24655 [Nocardiopsis sp. NPDC049922]
MHPSDLMYVRVVSSGSSESSSNGSQLKSTGELTAGSSSGALTSAP